jgi:hypothetical protein
LLCSVTRHHSLCLLFHLPRQCQRVTHTAVGCFLPLSHSWFCREWGGIALERNKTNEAFPPTLVRLRGWAGKREQAYDLRSWWNPEGSNSM